MPRYYLHVVEDGDTIHDKEGFEAPTDDRARQVALQAAGEVVSECLAREQPSSRIQLALHDEAGGLIARFSVSAELSVSAG